MDAKDAVLLIFALLVGHFVGNAVFNAVNPGRSLKMLEERIERISNELADVKDEMVAVTVERMVSDLRSLKAEMLRSGIDTAVIKERLESLKDDVERVRELTKDAGSSLQDDIEDLRGMIHDVEKELYRIRDQVEFIYAHLPFVYAP